MITIKSIIELSRQGVLKNCRFIPASPLAAEIRVNSSGQPYFDYGSETDNVFLSTLTEQQIHEMDYKNRYYPQPAYVAKNFEILNLNPQESTNLTEACRFWCGEETFPAALKRLAQMIGNHSKALYRSDVSSGWRDGLIDKANEIEKHLRKKDVR